MDLRDDALDQFLYSQLRERLVVAINGLPEYERVIIALYYYEGFGFDQIGIVVGVSAVEASQAFAAAIVNLRARLGDPDGNWEPSIHTSARPPTNGSKASLGNTVRPRNTNGDKALNN